MSKWSNYSISQNMCQNNWLIFWQYGACFRTPRITTNILIVYGVNYEFQEQKCNFGPNNSPRKASLNGTLFWRTEVVLKLCVITIMVVLKFAYEHKKTSIKHLWLIIVTTVMVGVVELQFEPFWSPHLVHTTLYAWIATIWPKS